MSEVIVATRKIYSGRIVKLDVHEVALADGQHSKREVIRHPGAAAVVALDADQNLLLVEQYRIAADRVLLELPAGTLYPEEPPEECALRELQEETGFKAGTLQSLGGFFAAPGYTTEYIHLFLGTDLTQSALPKDVDEVIEVVRLPFAEALRMVETGEIIDSKSIIGIMRVARLLGQ
jgi:ADP-ribose pyrophosphatase